MTLVIEILKVLASLAWPTLVAAALWHLLPSIRKVVESRAFTLKFAGIEVTTQEATDQIKSQLQDLKDQVIELRKATGDSVSKNLAPFADQSHKAILWVDDNPTNNALEISQLEERGYKVVKALSTNEAMISLAREVVGLIISDMGRREDGHYVAQAGLVLLKAAQEAGHNQPFLVYSSPKHANANDAKVRDLGGVGATASPTKLLELIETYLPRAGQTTPQIFDRY